MKPAMSGGMRLPVALKLGGAPAMRLIPAPATAHTAAGTTSMPCSLKVTTIDDSFAAAISGAAAAAPA